MNKPDQGFDYNRYRQLLADATDEAKRLALIDLLIEEGARDQLTRLRIGKLGLSTPIERVRNGPDSSQMPDNWPNPGEKTSER